MKSYYKDKNVIKAIIAIIGYFLLFNEIFPRLLFPLIAIMVLPFFKSGVSLKHFIEFYHGSDLYNNFATRVNAISMFVSYLLLLIILLALFWPKIKEDFLDYGKNTSRYNSSFWKFLGCHYLVTFAVAIFIAIVTTIISIELDNQNQGAINNILSSNSINFLLMMFPIIFFGPIVEELIFRKGMFLAIKNQKVAFIFSSSLFGLIHVMSSTTDLLNRSLVSVSYICAGVVLAFAYKKTNKNVLVVTLIHMFINAISIFIALLLFRFIIF